MKQEELLKMTWQVQAENDIYNAVEDWGYHRFACVMNDGTIAIFTGMRDENADGEFNLHIDCLDDCLTYDTDDIVYWIECPRK